MSKRAREVEGVDVEDDRVAMPTYMCTTINYDGKASDTDDDTNLLPT